MVQLSINNKSLAINLNADRVLRKGLMLMRKILNIIGDLLENTANKSYIIILE